MYTLYGHDGSSSAACFSTYGDYFATGGKDTVVQLWKSNFDIDRGEVLEGIQFNETNEQQNVTSFKEDAPNARKVAMAKDKNKLFEQDSILPDAIETQSVEAAPKVEV